MKRSEKENELRDFQRKLKASFVKDRSFIVLAPTGLGKTRAAILPFVEDNLGKSGNRIIYSLPLRALAKSVQEEFENFGIKPVIHHGEEPESNIFSERAVITTVDQYFTAFAGAPISWATAVSHASAGAALASYVVFDEAHLLNPKNGLQLLFAILKLRSRWGLPTVVMTATLPDSIVDFLESKCGLKKVEASEKDVKDRDYWREVNLTLYEKELTVDGLAGLVKEQFEKQGKIIVFVNTVERAINLYKRLKESNSLKNKILLAHSRFSKKHRSRIEEEIHARFVRNSDFEGILVTTQVAEAGLNISAPLVITELAPMDSLVQRAGRCARFKENSKKVKGNVMVVKPKVENGKWYAPYFDFIRLRKGGTGTNKNEALVKDKERITLSELTWAVLLEKVESSILLDWETEKELINLALNDVYYAFIEGSDTLYFRDQLEDKELGKIIKRRKKELGG